MVLGEKRICRSENADLWKALLVIYRNQVDFKWIKGHNNHPQNERCDELAVIHSTVVNRCFMRRKKEKFYEKFASLNRCNIVTYKLPCT
jgi:ribonuclease HI